MFQIRFMYVDYIFNILSLSLDVGSYYEIFLYITNLGIDFNKLFSFFEENTQKEIYSYIKFLKTKPSKSEFLNYKISKESFNIFAETIETLLKKVFKK